MCRLGDMFKWSGQFTFAPNTAMAENRVGEANRPLADFGAGAKFRAE